MSSLNAGGTVTRRLGSRRVPASLGSPSGPLPSAVNAVYLLSTHPLPVTILPSQKSVLKSIFMLHVDFKT